MREEGVVSLQISGLSLRTKPRGWVEDSKDREQGKEM